MCFDFSQANTNADTMTPTKTAMAKSLMTVTADTSTITNASALGIWRMTRKLTTKGANDDHEHDTG